MNEPTRDYSETAGGEMGGVEGGTGDVEGGTGDVEGEMGDVEGEMGDVDEEMGGVDEEMGDVDEEMGGVEGEMGDTEGGTGDATGRDDLVASLWPWSGRDSTAAVEIVVYVVTGTHGGLTIPERFCRECHRFVRAADVAAERVADDVRVSVRSWWTHLPVALRHGGYHAPVMIVGGKRLCQGYDVPAVEDVVAAIEEAHG